MPTNNQFRSVGDQAVTDAYLATTKAASELALAAAPIESARDALGNVAAELLGMLAAITDRRPVVRFTYRNYKGEVGVRTARITGVRYGVSRHHPDRQWFVEGFDLEKRAERTFAARDMTGLKFVGE